MRSLRFVAIWLCCLALISCTSFRGVRKPYIFYTNGEWPKSQIHLLEPDRSANRVLVESEEETFDNVMPSPEGKVLYRAWIRSEDRSEFWIMDIDSGTRTPIFQGSEPPHAARASWSGDGTKVAFSTEWERGQSVCSLEIYVIDLADNALTKLPITGWRYAWSPTDNRMAVSCANGESGLYVFDMDTGKKSRLFTKDPGLDLAWSPDGKSIAFVLETKPAVYKIFSVDVESGDLDQITGESSGYQHHSITCLSWSPEGDKILFVSDYSTEKVQQVGALFVLGLAGGTESNLAERIAWTCPAWSPEGDEIAFVSIMNPEYDHYGQIYKVNLSTRQITQLTDDSNPKLSLSWGWPSPPRTNR